MSNYTSENLVDIPASSVPAGTLALKIGNDVFTAGNIISGAEVTLGLIVNGQFQALTFSGTSADYDGSPETLSCYTWNLPTSSGSSGGSYTSSGGTIFTPVNISAGEIFEAMTIVSGGTLTVLSGGTANNTVVNNGDGKLIVSSGGIANNTVNSRGGISCFSGVVSGTTNFVSLDLISGSIASNTVVSGGDMLVAANCIANGAVIHYGGKMWVHGSASNITISSGGIFIWYDGAVTDNITSMAGAVISHGSL